MKNKDKKNNQTINGETNQEINSEGSNNQNLSIEQPDEKDLRIEQLEKEVNDSKDKFLRKAAEFENYKRRTENDQINLFKYAAESFIVKLLPVIDDFERSLLHMDTAKDVNTLKEGIHMIYNKLMKTLEDQGVTKIDAVGKPFDVHFHEAVMQQKADGAAPNSVLNEVEKGYLYKDRVLRHSKVIVSEDLTGETSDSQNGAAGNEEQ
ncbi:MAG: nucleotide exchange factor GrpE [Ignavibacteriaceae bacterium]